MFNSNNPLDDAMKQIECEDLIVLDANLNMLIAIANHIGCLQHENAKEIAGMLHSIIGFYYAGNINELSSLFRNKLIPEQLEKLKKKNS